MSDSELIYYCMLENQCAEEMLLYRYEAMLHSIVGKYRTYGESDDYEDAYQIALSTFYDALYTYREDHRGQFVTYLHQCVENRMINYVTSAAHLKNRMYMNQISLDDEVINEGSLGIDHKRFYRYEATTLFEKHSKSSIIEKTLEKCKESDREIIRLYLEGYTQKEIALILALNHRIVSKRIQLFINKARKCLRTYENN